MSNWYPNNKEEIRKLINSYLTEPKHEENVHGIITPHAGYAYSGQIAGKAYSLLKNQEKNRAIILSPSHYLNLNEIAAHNKENWQTPLGIVKITKNNFKKLDISQEHAIDNQIPFLQVLGFKEILPILVGEITQEQAKNISKQLLPYLKDAVLIVSTDLSHFLPYEQAKTKDNQTIKAIEKLDENKLMKIDNSACGIFPLLILIELAKLENYKPKLIDYKNSGDITGDKSSVVGYASFVF